VVWITWKLVELYFCISLLQLAPPSNYSWLCPWLSIPCFYTCLELQRTKCISRNFYPSPVMYPPQTLPPNPWETNILIYNYTAHFAVKGQNRESLVGLRARGIFFAIVASAGTRIPSNISASHFPVFSSIRQSTVASPMDSMIGEVTKGGCLIGSQWCCHILIFFPLPTQIHLWIFPCQIELQHYKKRNYSGNAAKASSYSRVS